MKKVHYIGIIIFGLMFLYIIPIGKSVSGTRYLNVGDSMTLSFSVEEGDKIKGTYNTIAMGSSAMVLTLAWAYEGNSGILTQNSGGGTITINIASGSGTYVITFINLGFVDGNLNYDIYVVRGDSNSDSIPSFNLSIIIIVSIGICGLLIRRNIKLNFNFIFFIYARK